MSQKHWIVAFSAGVVAGFVVPVEYLLHLLAVTSGLLVVYGLCMAYATRALRIQDERGPFNDVKQIDRLMKVAPRIVVHWPALFLLGALGAGIIRLICVWVAQA